MSDVDDQGSLPAYVEHERGRSARAKDVAAHPEPEEAASAADGADDDARAGGELPSARTPFEPSTGEDGA
jgi:hypothetical protein